MLLAVYRPSGLSSHLKVCFSFEQIPSRSSRGLAVIRTVCRPSGLSSHPKARVFQQTLPSLPCGHATFLAFGLRNFHPAERLDLLLHKLCQNCPTALPNFGLSAAIRDFHSVKKLGFALYYKPCLSLLGLPYPQNPVGGRLNRPRLFVRGSKNLSALFFGFVLLC